MARPLNTDYPAYCENYIQKTQSNCIQDLITDYAEQINTFFEMIPESLADHSYAQNKWTIKEVIQHIIDTERIFCYRALRFARKDKTHLAGFEENDYAINADASLRSLQSLKDEFYAVRKSTDLFLINLTNEQLKQAGTASNHLITVNALAYVIFGHVLHHIKIFEERYY
jgi:hypothetical protein